MMFASKLQISSLQVLFSWLKIGTQYIEHGSIFQISVGQRSVGWGEVTRAYLCCMVGLLICVILVTGYIAPKLQECCV